MTTRHCFQAAAEMMPRPASVTRPFSSCSVPTGSHALAPAPGTLQVAAQKTPGAIVKSLVQEMYAALASEGAKQASQILDKVAGLEQQLHNLANELHDTRQQNDDMSKKLEALGCSTAAINAVLLDLPAASASALSKIGATILPQTDDRRSKDHQNEVIDLDKPYSRQNHQAQQPSSIIRVSGQRLGQAETTGTWILLGMPMPACLASFDTAIWRSGLCLSIPEISVLCCCISTTQSSPCIDRAS